MTLVSTLSCASHGPFLGVRRSIRGLFPSKEGPILYAGYAGCKLDT
jgi:hypothetical protein